MGALGEPQFDWSERAGLPGRIAQQLILRLQKVNVKKSAVKKNRG